MKKIKIIESECQNIMNMNWIAELIKKYHDVIMCHNVCASLCRIDLSSLNISLSEIVYLLKKKNQVNCKSC